MTTFFRTTWLRALMCGLLITGVGATTLTMSSCAYLQGDTATLERYMRLMRSTITIGTNLVFAKNPQVVLVVLKVTTALKTMFTSQTVSMTVATMPTMMMASIKTMDIPEEYRVIVEELFKMAMEELHNLLVYYKVPDNEVVKYVMEVVNLVHYVAMSHVGSK